jgi:hypothetical protein
VYQLACIWPGEHTWRLLHNCILIGYTFRPPGSLNCYKQVLTLALHEVQLGFSLTQPSSRLLPSLSSAPPPEVVHCCGCVAAPSWRSLTRNPTHPT